MPHDTEGSAPAPCNESEARPVSVGISETQSQFQSVLAGVANGSPPKNANPASPPNGIRPSIDSGEGPPFGGDEGPPSSAPEPEADEDGDIPPADGLCPNPDPGEGETPVETWIPIGEILEREVSLYSSVQATEAAQTLSLETFIGLIQSDPDIQEAVETIRTAVANGTTLEEQRQLKRQLPAVTISGVFPGRRRGGEPVEHTGLLQVDIDDIGPEEVEELHERLLRDPRVAVIFRSPRNKLKVIVAIPRDPALHGRSFDAVQWYFRETYGVELDPSTRDVTRLCYLSADPCIHVSEGPVLQFEVGAEPPNHVPAERPDRPLCAEPPPCGIGAGTEVAAPCERWDVRRVRSALRMIARRGRPAYLEWLRIIAATREAIGDDQLALALLLEFFPEEIRGEYREKFRGGLARIPAGYLLDEAIRSGWNILDDCVVDLGGYLAKGPEGRERDRPPVIIDGLLRCGEMVLLAGRAKARKSFLTLDMCISVAGGRPLFGANECDGFQVTPGNVLLFDLENPPEEAAGRLASALEEIHNPAERIWTAERICLRALRGASIDDKIGLILETIRRDAVQGTLVIVDCLYPLIDGDINDMAKVVSILERFTSISASTGCGLVVIDHLRKGGKGNLIEQILGSVGKVMAPDSVFAMERLGSHENYRICASLRSFQPLDDIMLHYDDGTKRFQIGAVLENDSGLTSPRERADLAKLRLAWGEDQEAELSSGRCGTVWGLQGSGTREIIARLRERGWIEATGSGNAVAYRLLPEGRLFISEGSELFIG